MVMAAPVPAPSAIPVPVPVDAPAPVLAPGKPEPVHARPRVPVFASKKLRWIAGGGVAAFVAAAAVGVVMVRSHYKNKTETADKGSWHGTVEKIASVVDLPLTSGLDGIFGVCQANEKCGRPKATPRAARADVLRKSRRVVLMWVSVDVECASATIQRDGVHRAGQMRGGYYTA